MALRNRQDTEERQLKGVDRARDSTKFKLGVFRTLQNWVPAHVYSIKKKRGVELLVSTGETQIPVPCGCPPMTLPGEQALPLACCWDYNGFDVLTTNNAGMIAHIAPGGNFKATIAENTGFGSGPYPIATPTQTWFVIQGLPDCTFDDVTATPLTGYTANFQSTQPAQAGLCGKSDENSYLVRLSDITPFTPTGNANAHAYFDYDGGSFSFIDQLGPTTWCKYGSDFFGFSQNVAFSGIDHLRKWSLPAGGANTVSTPTGTVTGTANWDTTIQSFALHATSNYLYLLAGNGAPFANPTIYRIDKTTLVNVASWEITDADFAELTSIHVVNDDLIFLAATPSPTSTARFGYFIPSSTTTQLIGTLSVSGCVFWTGLPSGQQFFYYRQGYFYISTGGHVSGTTNVAKIGPLLCPGTNQIIDLMDDT